MQAVELLLSASDLLKVYEGSIKALLRNAIKALLRNSVKALLRNDLLKVYKGSIEERYYGSIKERYVYLLRLLSFRLLNAPSVLSFAQRSFCPFVCSQRSFQRSFGS